MFTNYDAQQVLQSNKTLEDKLIEMRDIEAGSGEILIHKKALKDLLMEIMVSRQQLRVLRKRK